LGLLKTFYYTNNLYIAKTMITTHEKYKKNIINFFLINNYIMNNLYGVLRPLAKYNFLLAT
jgi:hypothetical protein